MKKFEIISDGLDKINIIIYRELALHILNKFNIELTFYEESTLKVADKFIIIKDFNKDETTLEVISFDSDPIVPMSYSINDLSLNNLVSIENELIALTSTYFERMATCKTPVIIINKELAIQILLKEYPRGDWKNGFINEILYSDETVIRYNEKHEYLDIDILKSKTLMTSIELRQTTIEQINDIVDCKVKWEKLYHGRQE